MLIVERFYASRFASIFMISCRWIGESNIVSKRTKSQDVQQSDANIFRVKYRSGVLRLARKAVPKKQLKTAQGHHLTYHFQASMVSCYGLSGTPYTISK